MRLSRTSRSVICMLHGIGERPDRSIDDVGEIESVSSPAIVAAGWCRSSRGGATPAVLRSSVFGGELFLNVIEAQSGLTFAEFLQNDSDTSWRRAMW